MREDSTASCSASRSAAHSTCISLISSRSTSNCCLWHSGERRGVGFQLLIRSRSVQTYEFVVPTASFTHLLAKHLQLLPEEGAGKIVVP